MPSKNVSFNLLQKLQFEMQVMLPILMMSLVIIVCLSHLLAAWYSARNSGFLAEQATADTLCVFAVLCLMCLASAVTSKSGFLANFDALPPNLVLFILPHIVFTLLVGAISSYGRRLALNLPVAALVGFQAFRIPVELLLYELHREGLAPVQITYMGWNFDIFIGLTALPMAWLSMHSKVPRKTLMIWNWIGLILLLNVFCVALFSMPGPFRLFVNEPSAKFITEFPYILVPTFLVTSALLGHILVFRRLRIDDPQVPAEKIGRKPLKHGYAESLR